MKKLLILLLFPLLMFAQETTLVGDVDCSGEVNSQDASLILQFVADVIDELPCQENMTGLTPEQLQEIINMMDEQLSINYSGGGGSNYPIMISGISPETMYLGEAFVYCNDLEEGGYTDWFLPNLEQLTYAISGGCELPDERTDEYIWSTTKVGTSWDAVRVRESASDYSTYHPESAETQCRCVRFGEGETSEGSSNSSGSSVGGSSEQPITMIGPMYNNTDFPDFTTYNEYSSSIYIYEAYRFCGQLEYDGYNDWFVPSHTQLLDYIAEYSTLNIPNQTESSIEAFISSEYESEISFIMIDLEWGALYQGNTAGSSAKQCFCVR